MLPTDRADYRGASTRSLLAAVADRDPLALAEVYHRTSPAAYACAMRLLRGRDEVEALVRAAYLALWEESPVDAPLEAWVRHRVFVEGRAHLRELGQAAASPSTTLLLRDAPLAEAPLDRTERLIAGLDDDALRALLLAHDRGIPTVDQRNDGADAGLRRALAALAEAEDDTGDCRVERLADLVLGLLTDDEAERVHAAATASPACAEALRTLKRGRRRIEGLPPPPDLGQRVVAYVLTASAGTLARPAPAPPAPVEDPAAGAPEQDPGRDVAAEQPQTQEPAPSEDRAEPPEPPASDIAAEHEPPEPPAPDIAAEHAPTGQGMAEGIGPTGVLAPNGPGQSVPAAAPPEADEPASALEGEYDHELGATADDAPSALDEDASLPESAPPEFLRSIEETPPPGQAQPPGSGDEAPTDPATRADQPSLSWSSPRAAGSGADGSPSFESLEFENEDESRGRRVLTIVLTVVGVLLLLAAGGVAGIIALRIFVG